MPLPKITLVPILHHEEWKILVEFDYEINLVQQIKKLPSKWSQTHKSWYVTYNKYNYDWILTAFEDLAEIDSSKINVVQNSKSSTANDRHKRTKTVDESTIQIPENYLKTLMHRRFSDSTFKTYTSLFKRFMVYYKDEDLDTITKDQIVDYLLHLIKTKNISTSTQNQVINAIKFYYEKVLNRETQQYWINRPQREFKLPTVLSEEEVMDMFKVITNLKHLTIVALLYSAGLRRGELINIKKGDIDMHRKQIKVAKGKGKKDRMTVLSDYMAELLKQYVKEYKPTYWLFESPSRGPYSTSSVAAIIRTASKNAGITKHVTPHVLRHSFATHLMDQGIETRYIQTLLGHSSLETTAMYTHVSTRSISQVKSPLDKLLDKKKKDDEENEKNQFLE